MDNNRPLGTLLPMAQTSPLSVSLLALPESTVGTLYSLYEVFAAAGVAWREATGEGAGEPFMEPRILSYDGRSYVSPCGPVIAPQARLGDFSHSDIVVIGDLQFAPHEDVRGRWPEEAAWCREQYEKGALLCSVCTGSVFLADTGVLNGSEATSHWAAADLFTQLYPEVTLLPDRVLVLSGEDQRIITSGGASSWQDLALYLIGRFCGASEAIHIAKLFLLSNHGEGQLPYAAMTKRPLRDDPVIAQCQTWLADHYHQAHPVKQMIGLSGFKERTFKRRFQAATGYSPMGYVQALRIEEAKQLLETTDEAIDEIAAQIGYEDSAFFRRLFKRSTGITPGRYRQRFQSIGRQLSHPLPEAGQAGIKRPSGL